MDKIQGSLDLPINGQTIIGGALLIQGWVFSENKDDFEIETYIDDKFVQKTRWGLPRNDIYTLHSKESAYESGFADMLKVGYLTTGKHSVKIIAVSSKSKIKKLLGYSTITKKKKKPDDKNTFFHIPTGGGGKFTNSGSNFLDIFKNVANLQSTATVLDLGCGMGRIALPLTKFLQPTSEYFGLDTIPWVIDYCKSHISSRFSNFNFGLIDVHNKMYNPDGEYDASNYKFPYKDEKFDFISLISVFTHMIPIDLENYVSEISRVLKKNGKCLLTFFLLNSDRDQNIKNNLTKKTFKFHFSGYRSEFEKIPEKAIAFEETIIRDLLKKYNLIIQEPIHFGEWGGSISYLYNQDIIVCEKSKNNSIS